ncbi:MAG: 16S rRNA (guanine(527)-N(7))-methyltransferase RsmG [Microcystaceae cyanobacterium]
MTPLPQLTEIWENNLNWQPTAHQWQQLERLYQLTLEGNECLNLTRITEPTEFVEKHLWDSLAGLFLADSVRNLAQAKVIDIGTGAGFPGIPTAIAFPNWSVTLLDSTRKKIQWLTELVTALNINNTQPLVARCESLGRDRLHREKYDLALIRAVADARVCAEYALPLLKPGGWVVLYRGQWQPLETKKLVPVVEALGGKVENIVEISTPLTASVRNFLYLQKVQATPSIYPRAIGMARQNPLS